MEIKTTIKDLFYRFLVQSLPQQLSSEQLAKELATRVVNGLNWDDPKCIAYVTSILKQAYPVAETTKAPTPPEEVAQGLEESEVFYVNNWDALESLIKDFSKSKPELSNSVIEIAQELNTAFREGLFDVHDCPRVSIDGECLVYEWNSGLDVIVLGIYGTCLGLYRDNGGIVPVIEFNFNGNEDLASDVFEDVISEIERRGGES